MGFFSWKTQDTERSIANIYSGKPTFKVIMTDNKGNQWIENDYEGYGIFGGKDYYELVSEMNHGDADRDRGIRIGFELPSSKDEFLFPSLTENGEYYNGIEPELCEHQGFFYPELQEDEQ